MDHNEVQLIGVFGTEDDPSEPFVYTVDAPTNLWVSCRTANGTMMGHKFAAWGLNELLEADAFAPGDFVDIVDQNDVVVRFTVGDEAPAHDPAVQAYQARSTTVRLVAVTVVEP